MTGQKILSVLDIMVSIVVLAGLLPLTEALPAIATPIYTLANALWFTVGLGGAFLLLAAGPKLLLNSVSVPIYIAAFASLLACAGALRLHSTGFTRLTAGWLTMTLSVAAMLFVLKRPWAWGLVGGLCSGLLLGAWSSIGVYSYVTTPTRIFSKLLPVQVVASILAIVVALVHLRLRPKPS